MSQLSCALQFHHFNYCEFVRLLNNKVGDREAFVGGRVRLTSILWTMVGGSLAGVAPLAHFVVFAYQADRAFHILRLIVGSLYSRRSETLCRIGDIQFLRSR